MRVLFWNLRDVKARQSIEEEEMLEVANKKKHQPSLEKDETSKEANRKRHDALIDAIVRLGHAENHQIDIFFFAEFHLNPKKLLEKLNEGKEREYRFIPNEYETAFDGPRTTALAQDKTINKAVEKNIHIFARLDASQLPRLDNLPATIDWEKETFEHSRLTLRRLKMNDGVELLLAVVHLISKLNFSPISQREEARRIARRIRYVEQEIIKHHRTVLIGDFNMDPYEEGMTLPDTFHSVLWQRFSERIQGEGRGIQNTRYPCFYNPMWSHWGDGENSPGGTFAYTSGNHDVYGWHIYDQVLLRPEALEYWDYRSLEIVTQVESVNFLTASKRPAKVRLTDHLPVRFQLREPGHDTSPKQQTQKGKRQNG